ncbi:MAG: NB-ARC domain-containing protein, partial [Cyanobacteria bacterium J06576_12]
LGDETGKAKVVPNEVLSELLRNFADSLECVVLNVCHSAALADELAGHLNYVIGMNRAVFDDSAIAFSVGFYDALSAGESYEKAFGIAKSAVFGRVDSRDRPPRKATAVGNNTEANNKHKPEHLIPVLKVNPNPTEIKESKQPDSESSATNTASDINPFGVPYQRNRYFAGREVVLLQLHEQLTQTSAAAMTQVQAISGLGGIGKTQTAVEYAYRYHYDQAVYEAVFWVNADTETTLASDLASIAEQVAVPGAEVLQQEQKIQKVHAWLSNHHDWLLIFDNADQPDRLADWMPTTPNGKVLITSRASVFDQIGIQTPLALDVLSEAEALTLLFESTGIARTAEAEKSAIDLNQELDGLPLALEQARAYIARQKISFRQYLHAY